MPETTSAGPRRTGPANLKAMAAREIRRRVFAGQLRAGAKIDQEALADELGISKLPVREAQSRSTTRSGGASPAGARSWRG